MDKDVEIKVIGYQTGENGETDTNETVHKARYFLKNGQHYVVYENEETAESARYKLTHRSLEVIRNGDLSSKMVFEAGRTFTSVYRTPYGRMRLTFVTKQFAFYEENGTLKCNCSYTILNENDYIISENRINLTVSEL